MLTTSSVNLLVGSSVILFKKIPVAVYDEYFLLGEFGGGWGFVFGYSLCGEFLRRPDWAASGLLRMTDCGGNHVPAYQKPSHNHGLLYAGSLHQPGPLSS